MPEIPKILALLPRDLQVLERCRNDLAMMTDLSSVLEMRDKAQAIKNYMKARDDSRASQNSAACIAALAEARAGQLLKEGQQSGTIARPGAPINNENRKAVKDVVEEAPKDNGPRQGPLNPDDPPLRLLDLEITKNESSRLKIAAEVAEKDPEWFDRHRRECDENNWDFTQQSVVRRGKEIRNEEIGRMPIEAPVGTYDVIVIDPPWPVHIAELETKPQVSETQGTYYPTMTEEELSSLVIPSAENCHVWVWTTQRFLPMALRLLPLWGVKYSCTFVWQKSKGHQVIGLPYYNCEFALYGRIGTPKFATTKDFKTCQSWPSGAHSEKPEEFYAMVARVTEGRRLDMFSRRAIEGFEAWGKEAPPGEGGLEEEDYSETCS